MKKEQNFDINYGWMDGSMNITGYFVVSVK